jgi:hypothetical protein
MVPSGETLYRVNVPYLSMVVRGRDNDVQAAFELPNGSPATSELTACTYSLLDPGGVAVVDAVAATVALGVASYTIPAATLPATLAPLGEGWQEVWDATLDGVAKSYDVEAALVLRPLYPVLTQADLVADYPDLAATRGVTVTTDEGFITQSWQDDVINRLIGEGHLPYLIKSAPAFKRAHKEATHARRFRWLGSKQRDGAAFVRLAETHQKRYESAWKAINFRTDDNHDGRVDDPGSRRSSARVVHRNASPSPTRKRRNTKGWF